MVLRGSTRRINILHKNRLINYLNGMPQLDFLSYMSQLVGLLMILMVLYLITVRWVLPHIKTIQEVRNLSFQEKPKVSTPLEPFSHLLINHGKLLEAHGSLTTSQATHLFQKTTQTYLKRASKEYGILLSHLLIQRNVS
jgi:hypothetical protein